MARVFLSYSKLDRPLAARVADALRLRGLSVWWDQELTPRENWDLTIEREITDAEYVLVLWTRNSTLASAWVRIEANYAVNCKPSKLVQVRFDDCTIPMAFSLVQYLDLDPAAFEWSADWGRAIGWLGGESGPGPAPPGDAVPTDVAPHAETGPLGPQPPDRDAEMLLWLAWGALLAAIPIALIQIYDGIGMPAVLNILTVSGPWLFGLPYLWLSRRSGGWVRRLAFFAIAVPVAYVSASIAATFAGAYFFPGSWSELVTFPGALVGSFVGGAIGASLSFAAGMLLRVLRSDAWNRRIALAGAASLAVAPFPFAVLARGTYAENYLAFAAMQLAWQILFAYWLARTSRRRPAPGRPY
jgi:hypothetical protein